MGAGCMAGDLEAERAAQREEFLKREKKGSKIPSQRFQPRPQPKKSGKAVKSKALTFDQKLAVTEQWLEETFPHLFVADDYVPLDHHLLRDIKADYKNNIVKKNYPQDLVIKGALSRYKESYGYLECLKEGAERYSLKGEICGTVTKEEEEAAKKILNNN